MEPLLQVRQVLADEAQSDREAVARIATLQAALDAMIASVAHLERRLARIELVCAALNPTGYHDDISA